MSAFGLMLLARQAAFSRWRRSAVRGLPIASEKGELPKFDLRMDDLIDDIPVPLRWIASALLLFFFYQSLKGLWIEVHAFSLTRIENYPIADWLVIPAAILWLWYGGKLLNYAVRRYRRRLDQAQKAA